MLVSAGAAAGACQSACSFADGNLANSRKLAVSGIGESAQTDSDPPTCCCVLAVVLAPLVPEAMNC